MILLLCGAPIFVHDPKVHLFLSEHLQGLWLLALVLIGTTWFIAFTLNGQLNAERISSYLSSQERLIAWIRSLILMAMELTALIMTVTYGVVGTPPSLLRLASLVLLAGWAGVRLALTYRLWART
jgi:hypothetical protein